MFRNKRLVGVTVLLVLIIGGLMLTACLPTATVTVWNDGVGCTLNLRLTGPRTYNWSIANNAQTTYKVRAGTYNWQASGTCIQTTTGTETFQAGGAYMWRFWTAGAQLQQQLSR